VADQILKNSRGGGDCAFLTLPMQQQRKRGPKVLSEDLVVRSYEFGEVKGSITLAPSTPLNTVCKSILKRFHQDHVFFQTELKNGVYVVSEKMINSGSGPQNYSQWKAIMQQEHPDHFFSPLNTVPSIPPAMLDPIIVTNVIYSHLLEGRYYYALPRSFVTVRNYSTVFIQRAIDILDGFNGLESVSSVGILGNGIDCGFSPASFTFREGVTFHWNAPAASVAPIVKSEQSTEHADSSLIIAARIVPFFDGLKDMLPIVEIIKRNQPTLELTEELDAELLTTTTLLQLEAYFQKQREDLKQLILKQQGKRKLNALLKQHNFATMDNATLYKIEASVVRIAPSPPTHTELKALAQVVKKNTADALVSLKDELRRLSGAVISKDHHVTPIDDEGACYRMPTIESIELSSDSSSE
jgi:hypothetical protein